MNKGKILLITLAGMLAVSCATDTVDQPGSVALDATSAKLINTSTAALSGELLLYVDEASVEQFATAKGSTIGISDFDAAAQEVGAESIEPVFNLAVDGDAKRALGMDRWYVVNFSKDIDVAVAAEKFAKSAAIERIQFNTQIVAPRPNVTYVDAAAATRAEEGYYNDPMLPLQWHYTNTGNKEISPIAVEGADINAIPAWDIVKGSNTIIVAVMDEAVDYTHEDLKDNMLANEAELNGEPGVDDDGNGYVDDVYGYNFSDDGALTWDLEGDTGHGTHVAGTIAAVNNNGIGVSGVAGGSGIGDGVRIISTQIFSGDSGNSVTPTARAAEYAADRGAVILQCSWGLPSGTVPNDNSFKNGYYSAQYVAFKYFAEKKNHPALDGGLVIFAAGNEGYSSSSYPGAYTDYISVTATAPDGLPAYYTNYGPGCNVAAPGGEYYRDAYTHYQDTGCVLSTMPGNQYGYMQGTSMACPHVSGIAALALAYAEQMGKTYSVKQMQTILLTSVNNLNMYLHEEQKRIQPETLEEYNMAKYYNKVGTGSIDAFRVLMAVRGTVCVPVVAGEENVIKISSLYGDGNTKLAKLESVIVPDDVRARLGIKNETIFGDELIFECANTGAGVITVQLIAGGDMVGSGQNTGGMLIEKEIGIVAREGNVVDEPIGGWL